MEKGKNLAIFDFCDTLVHIQSADEFCRFVLKKESRTFYLKIDKFFDRFFIYRLFAKFNFISFRQKNFLLKGLKGLSVSKIETHGLDYVRMLINKELNDEVFSRFLSHLESGDLVVINSGGYEPYLKHFSKIYNIKFFFSTRFKYDNDIFTGQIEGIDCLGSEKVRRMNEIDLFNSTYLNVFVYSDSVTDMPIFDLATHKVAIVKYKVVPKWCQSNFEIIKV